MGDFHMPGTRGTVAGAARLRQAGTSLVETLVAVAVLSTVMSAAMAYVVTSWRFSQLNQEKVFAYEKAVAILTEMQAYLETSAVEAASDLDSFDDSTGVTTALTITRDPADATKFVDPAHPSSGNIQHLGFWRWSRKITVKPFPGVLTRDLRIVTVAIFRTRDGMDPATDVEGPAGTPDGLPDNAVKFAEVSSVLRTIADAFPTTQVYDVYLLSAENVPGWWVFMQSIRPMIEATINDLENRNPGLKFRTHWITKLGYGRDPYYRPYWNFVNDSRAAIPFVHFYPAKMPTLAADVGSAWYYDPTTLKAWVRRDSANPETLTAPQYLLNRTEQNGYDNAPTAFVSTTGTVGDNPNYNPFPYTLADNWNHCMRSVDEEAYFRLRREYGGALPDSVGAEDDTVPTWHLLLDRMKGSPALYRNAIFVNLHGELLPLPPMRGISDPAKDPRPALSTVAANPKATVSDFYGMSSVPGTVNPGAGALTWIGGHPGVRVVTHPEQQRYVRGAAPEDARLRVYAFLDAPEKTGAPSVLSDPIDIQIFGMNLAQRVQQVGPLNFVDMGTMAGPAPSANRATWTSCSFPTNPINAGIAASAGAPYIQIEAIGGGLDVAPTAAAVGDGIPDAYAKTTPVVLGLGEDSFANRSPLGPALFPAIVTPAAWWANLATSTFTIAGTTRPEGYLAGYRSGAAAFTHTGVNPLVRIGYVPPNLDAEGVGYTLIRLYNTPLKCPLADGPDTDAEKDQGLEGLLTPTGAATTVATNLRLYGREYIPTTCETTNDFTRDLAYEAAAVAGDGLVEKNTARWVITIKKDALGIPAPGGFTPNGNPIAGVMVRNARARSWTSILAPDANHPADPDDSDHWPVTVTTRIGSRVHDYDQSGTVDPFNAKDTEEGYLFSNWAAPTVTALPYTAAWRPPSAAAVMDVVERDLYSGAMWPNPTMDPAEQVRLAGPSSYTYTGGLLVRVPAGLQQPVTVGFPLAARSLNGGALGVLLNGYGFQNRPENLSTTYFWWTDSPLTDVPASEQAQFLGDPRHCPYRDFKDPVAPGPTVLNFPNAYNWYFDNFRNATDLNQAARWPGFNTTKIRNLAGDMSEGWNNNIEVDVPRFFKTLRESLASANMLWTTLTGFSYYYIGLGNEIGYDSANSYTSSVPVDGQPFGSAADGYEQSITNNGPGGTWGNGVKLVRSIDTLAWLFNTAGVAQSYWWGANWIGEQYPDGDYLNWARNGNLAAGTVAGTFKRVRRSDIGRSNTPATLTLPSSLPYGTRFTDFNAAAGFVAPMQRRTSSEGCISFFNIGTVSTATFRHDFKDGQTGSLTATVGGGNDLASDYSFPFPSTQGISRPFGIDRSTAGGTPTEYSEPEYATQPPTVPANRFKAFTVMQYFNHATVPLIGSGLIQNRNQNSASQAAYIVVNGLDKTTETGSAFIAKYAMVSLIHSFFVGGFVDGTNVTAANRIPQLPRVQVVTPTILTQLKDPPTIPVQWSVSWTRWDGRPYTKQYLAGFVEVLGETNLRYVPSWSSDNGKTWVSMVDNASAITPGEVPANAALVLADTSSGADETLTWSTPAALFPRSSYLVRVECYRSSGGLANSLHYSFHQEKIYIDR